MRFHISRKILFCPQSVQHHGILPSARPTGSGMQNSDTAARSSCLRVHGDLRRIFHRRRKLLFRPQMRPQPSITTPMSYGISFTSGPLIPSFCLSIKGRHDAPLLSLCSDGKKSDLALYVYEFLLFLSAPCGGRLLNLTVVLLMLPVVAYEYLKASSADRRSLHLPGWHKRLLSAYS